MLTRIGHAYELHTRDRPPEAALIATLAYFVALVAVRLFTTLTKAGADADINIGATHIHHVVFGIAAILISGMLALDETHRLFRAALFGIGAALVLDEFALVVFLKDVYWLPQGLLSGFALVVGLLALAINLFRSRAFILEVRGPREKP